MHWPPPKLTDVSAAFGAGSAPGIWMLHEPAHVLAGNKRFKLERNLERALEQGKKGVVSFGGAWSNHVAALAHATCQRGLQCVCIIRGEPAYLSNATLSEARRQGAHFEFVTRQEYRKRMDLCWMERLQQRFPDFMLLPEGGSNTLAVESCTSMLDTMDVDFRDTLDLVACPVGTGATLSGLRLGLNGLQQVRGYLAVNDPETRVRMERWWSTLRANDLAVKLSLVDASAPGYARLEQAHYRCISHWLETTGILLDPVYTVKMVSVFVSEIDRGLFSPDTRIVLLHTGGYQGWRGWLDGDRNIAMRRHLSSSAIAEIERVIHDSKIDTLECTNSNPQNA
ncbi:MAG: pyridoxal-phosphate dependent enzyme [Granulosicoccus sp.]|nr:pyridoxal-phosphate dependent enzyme [Granulosicoccus sp.]